jgi:lysophospholipase L1-like esterase
MRPEDCRLKSVVLIGDSIRMGYEEEVRSVLEARAEVWGPQANGGDSNNVLEHLDEWVTPRSPDVVHVNCGLHDIKKAFGEDRPAVTLEAYTRNVKRILRRLQSRIDAAVLWASTTPVHERRHHENKPFDRFEADVVAYNAAANGVACELGVAVNDLFAAVQEAGPDELLSKDGVHFRPEGYALLGRAVARCVGQHL